MPYKKPLDRALSLNKQINKLTVHDPPDTVVVIDDDVDVEGDTEEAIPLPSPSPSLRSAQTCLISSPVLYRERCGLETSHFFYQQ